MDARQFLTSRDTLVKKMTVFWKKVHRKKHLIRNIAKKVYSEWQQLMVDEIPVFPTLYRSKLVPINKRVVNYSIGADFMGLHEVGVTQEKPFKAE